MSTNSIEISQEKRPPEHKSLAINKQYEVEEIAKSR